MGRALTTRNLLDKKFKTFAFTGIWNDVFSNPETTGVWLIYGTEKNGKTWFALKFAEYLSSFVKTLYVSAEEATDKTFIEAVKRAKLNPHNRNLHFISYEPLEELNKRLLKRKSAKIVFIDNVTIYKDELRNGAFRKMAQMHKNKLLIFIAHEERNEPDGATAKLIKKLSKIYIRVRGLSCIVAGRCPGGQINIDEEKAQLYHGTK